jgi:hypothetical protein
MCNIPLPMAAVVITRRRRPRRWSSVPPIAPRTLLVTPSMLGVTFPDPMLFQHPPKGSSYGGMIIELNLVCARWYLITHQNDLVGLCDPGSARSPLIHGRFPLGVPSSEMPLQVPQWNYRFQRALDFPEALPPKSTLLSNHQCLRTRLGKSGKPVRMECSQRFLPAFLPRFPLLRLCICSLLLPRELRCDQLGDPARAAPVRVTRTHAVMALAITYTSFSHPGLVGATERFLAGSTPPHGGDTA